MQIILVKSGTIICSSYKIAIRKKRTTLLPVQSIGSTAHLDDMEDMWTGSRTVVDGRSRKCSDCDFDWRLIQY